MECDSLTHSLTRMRVEIVAGQAIKEEANTSFP